MGLRVSYLGSRSVNLIYRRNLNQPPPSLTPFSTSLRPYGLYNQVIYGDSGGTEVYHALEARGAEEIRPQPDVQHGLDLGARSDRYAGQRRRRQLLRRAIDREPVRPRGGEG